LDVFIPADDDIGTVRATFSWSYQALPADAARMFRLLGLHAGHELSLPAAAALAGLGPDQARVLLSTLTGRCMLEETRPGRYRLHDLLHLYAAERTSEVDGPIDRQAASRLMLAWYAHTADAADRILIPRRRVPLDDIPAPSDPVVFAGYDQALAWCETERANLVAAARQAAAARELVIAWKLPVALWGFFNVRKHWADWLASHHSGLAAARELGDKSAVAWTLGSLSIAYWDLRQYDQAISCLQDAQLVCQDQHDWWGIGITHLVLGLVYRDLGEVGQEMDHLQQALTIVTEVKDQWAECVTLNSLGQAYADLSEPAAGIEYLDRALEVARDTDDRWAQGWILRSMGGAYQQLGDVRNALARLKGALSLDRNLATGTARPG
jgi:tetratricopeptide (TPR) repeat protein